MFKLLERGFASWQKRKQRKEFLRYQIKPREDSRNSIARWLDSVVSLAVFWFLVLLVLVSFLPDLLALLVSILSTIALGLIRRRIRIKQSNQHRQHLRMWIAGKKCLEEIRQLKTQEEVIAFVALLLAQLPDFKDIRINPFRQEKTIAIHALYKDIPVAVGCLPPSDNAAPFINSLDKGLKRQGYKSAILVIPGEISPETHKLTSELQCNTVLLGEKELVELSLKTRDQASVEEGIPSAGRKPSAEIRKIIFTKEKGTGYLVNAAVLSGVYLALKPLSSLHLIYIGFIILNLGLFLLCMIGNRKQKELFADLERLESKA